MEKDWTKRRVSKYISKKEGSAKHARDAKHARERSTILKRGRPVIHDLSVINHPVTEFPFSDSIRVLILQEAKRKNYKIVTRKIGNKLMVYNLS